MGKSIVILFFAIVAILAAICEFYGLYIAYNSSMAEGIIATIIPPYAIVLGFMGFF